MGDYEVLYCHDPTMSVAIAIYIRFNRCTWDPNNSLHACASVHDAKKQILFSGNAGVKLKFTCQNVYVLIYFTIRNADIRHFHNNHMILDLKIHV